jgi:hypothetical protein
MKTKAAKKPTLIETSHWMTGSWFEIQDRGSWSAKCHPSHSHMPLWDAEHIPLGVSEAYLHVCCLLFVLNLNSRAIQTHRPRQHDETIVSMPCLACDET